jgi:hypothetical protein
MNKLNYFLIDRLKSKITSIALATIIIFDGKQVKKACPDFISVKRFIASL